MLNAYNLDFDKQYLACVRPRIADFTEMLQYYIHETFFFLHVKNIELYRTDANDNPFHSQIRFRLMLWDFYFLYLKFQKNETPVF